MGEYNSSVTRVWPVFDFLFKQEPRGTNWLPALLALAKSAGEFKNFDPGPLLPQWAEFDRSLPAPIARAVGPDAAKRIGRVRNAYEVDLPPSAAFLRWLIENPKQLTWPKSGGSELIFGDQTQSKRKQLIAGDTGVQNEALEELESIGARGSRRKWWAFEGFTSVDCYLETESLLLLVEGKRTEPISASTAWFPRRNQVIRNVEVAQALSAGRKHFAVLVCAEEPTPLPQDSWTKSLPHFSSQAVGELKQHYLGCVLWSDIVKALCHSLRLPDKLEDAITLCCELRGTNP